MFRLPLFFKILWDLVIQNIKVIKVCVAIIVMKVKRHISAINCENKIKFSSEEPQFLRKYTILKHS